MRLCNVNEITVFQFEWRRSHQAAQHVDLSRTLPPKPVYRNRNRDCSSVSILCEGIASRNDGRLQRKRCRTIVESSPQLFAAERNVWPIGQPSGKLPLLPSSRNDRYANLKYVVDFTLSPFCRILSYAFILFISQIMRCTYGSTKISAALSIQCS